jgi:hypothetical protein
MPEAESLVVSTLNLDERQIIQVESKSLSENNLLRIYVTPEKELKYEVDARSNWS